MTIDSSTKETKEVGVQTVTIQLVYAALEVVQGLVRQNKKRLDDESKNFLDKMGEWENKIKDSQGKIEALETKVSALEREIDGLKNGEQSRSFGTVGRMDGRLTNLERTVWRMQGWEDQGKGKGKHGFTHKGHAKGSY